MKEKRVSSNYPNALKKRRQKQAEEAKEKKEDKMKLYAINYDYDNLRNRKGETFYYPDFEAFKKKQIEINSPSGYEINLNEYFKANFYCQLLEYEDGAFFYEEEKQVFFAGENEEEARDFIRNIANADKFAG